VCCNSKDGFGTSINIAGFFKTNYIQCLFFCELECMFVILTHVVMSSCVQGFFFIIP